MENRFYSSVLAAWNFIAVDWAYFAKNFTAVDWACFTIILKFSPHIIEKLGVLTYIHPHSPIVPEKQAFSLQNQAHLGYIA